ncbi:MAG: methylmalonyl-CoA epimerase [Anaerolineae bacterium]|nr:methylmalonyl-CoA epimerase [Anaerolineae bacterium]
MGIKAVNHVAIVVEDIESALAFWRDALGLPLARTERMDAEAVEVAFLPVGESEIELLEPTTPDSGVARFLEKRGPGIHHICIEVDDIAATMARLRAHGVTLINETPREGPGGRQYAFIHPRSAGGVLVELYQLPAE